MKKILVITFIVISVGFAFGQDNNPANKQVQNDSGKNTKSEKPMDNIPEPEYIGVFWGYDLENKKSIPLERSTLQVFSGTNTGFLSAKSTAISGLTGLKSPTRFYQNQKIVFIVRAESNLIDPMNLLEIRKFDFFQQIRVYSMSNAKFGIGGGGTNSKIAAPVEINISKLGAASFKISMELVPGEYVFASKQNSNIFCFGIDRDPNLPKPDLKPIAGRYLREKSKKDILDLSADGTFSLEEKGKKYAGSFELEGSKITLSVNGQSVVGEINENVITDKENQKWIKQID